MLTVLQDLKRLFKKPEAYNAHEGFYMVLKSNYSK